MNNPNNLNTVIPQYDNILKKNNIKSLKIGEIFYIDSVEYVLCNRECKNGKIIWKQPSLIKLEYLINNISRKPYYNKMGIKKIPLKAMKKGFKGLKLSYVNSVERGNL